MSSFLPLLGDPFIFWVEGGDLSFRPEISLGLSWALRITQTWVSGILGELIPTLVYGSVRMGLDFGPHHIDI